MSRQIKFSLVEQYHEALRAGDFDEADYISRLFFLHFGRMPS